jgi:hypothetical protein
VSLAFAAGGPKNSEEKRTQKDCRTGISRCAAGKHKVYGTTLEETWVLGYFGFSARCQRYPTTPTAATMITNKAGSFSWNHEPTEYAKIPIPTANKRAIRGLPEKPCGFGILVSNMLFLPWSAVRSEKFYQVAHWKTQVSQHSRNRRNKVVLHIDGNSVANASTGLPTIAPFLWKSGVMNDLGALGGRTRRQSGATMQE